MNEDIQHKTVDKGWTSMKALLDQEMPVNEKRRRFIWWWFALLLLPLLVVGGWYWAIVTSSGKGPVEQPKPSPSMPFATEQSNKAALKPGSSVIEKTAEANDPAMLIATVKTPEKAFIQKQITPILQASSNHIQQIQVVETSHTPNVESSNASPIQPALKPQELDAMAHSPEKTAVVAVPAASPVFDILPVSAPFVQSQIIPIDPPTVAVECQPIDKTIVPTKKSRWAFGVGTVLGTEQFKAINSMGAGVAIQWQPLRRLGLRSGLNYVQYAPSEKSQPTVIVHYEQYIEALNSQFEITDLAGNNLPVTGSNLGQVDAVIIPVSKLSMVEMPLLISYKLPHRITVFSGITSSYLLDSKARQESYSTNYTFKTNTALDRKNLNALASSNLDRWRFDFQAGLGLGLGRQWELGFFAKLPMQRGRGANSNSGPTVGNAFLDVQKTSVNVKNRLPMTFALRANYFIHSR